ncbi:MAG: YigZ family protein [Alloprevotella sp.]|nr:YigZ family protein [Alloprevotella sp.]
MLATPSEGTYTEKRSKFLAFAFPIESKEEATEILHTLQKRFHDARHICYAYSIGIDSPEERANDDGEPSGTGGRPILGQIHSFGINNVLLAVVRYYGGVPLGAANLGRAYQQAAFEALHMATIETRELIDSFSFFARYEDVELVMRQAKKSNARVSYLAHHTDGADMQVSTRRSEINPLREELMKIHTLKWSSDAIG